MVDPSTESRTGEDGGTQQVRHLDDDATGLKYLRSSWHEGDVREVRILKWNKWGHTASGYFDSPEAAAEAIQDWDGKASIFVSLNPVNPALLARAHNRIVERAEHTTADRDIVRRDWLLIDVDPNRPAGISSTDQEMRMALECLEDVHRFLAARGWPEPLKAMSGNGGYLLYRIALRNAPQDLELVNGVLAALAARFSTDTVQIDVTVGNASRLVGLVGTKKMKGDDTPTRPHRRSMLLENKPCGAPVPFELLCALAAEAPTHTAGTSGASTGKAIGYSGDGRLAQMLSEAGIESRRQPPDANGVTWYHIRQCPFHSDGRPFECGVGETLPRGPFAGHCFHPEGNGKGWREFADALGLHALTDKGRAESGPEPEQDRDWPALPEAAFYGIAGELVRAIEPHSEADPVAMLVNLLVGFGNLVGSAPRFRISATDHHTNQYAVLVGDTAKARKGESWTPIKLVLVEAASRLPGATAQDQSDGEEDETAPGEVGRIVTFDFSDLGTSPSDLEWGERIITGLSTGEGLVHQVRDPREEERDGKVKTVDPGVEDKRLLVVETEFGRTLRVMKRENTTLSTILRQAWDHETLRVVTKVDPATASDAHISILAHITMEELQAELTSLSAANGLGNRFPFFVVKRSKLLPVPAPIRGEFVERLALSLVARILNAAAVLEMYWSDEAEARWRQIYAELSPSRSGLAGALTARSEPHTLRFAMIYALLDGTSEISLRHLEAAYAVVRYSMESVRFIWGDSTGNEAADRILKELRRRGRLTKSDVWGLFGRNIDAARLDAAARLLEKHGDLKRVIDDDGNGGPGRPAEVWLWPH